MKRRYIYCVFAAGIMAGIYNSALPLHATELCGNEIIKQTVDENVDNQVLDPGTNKEESAPETDSEQVLEEIPNKDSETEIENNESQEIPLYPNGENSDIKNEDEKIKNGWSDDHKQYYENDKFVVGLHIIDGHQYYFDKQIGYITTGIFEIPAEDNGGSKKIVYFNNEGQMVFGEVRINGSWYYFDLKTGQMASGLVNMPGGAKNIHYYDNQGKLKIGTFTVGKTRYTTDSSGKIIKTELLEVPYYSQRDPRWASIWYGQFGNIGSTGCTCTAATMMINYYLGTNYTPQTLCDFLYRNGFYNSGTVGTTSDVWRFLANYYGFTYKNNLSYDGVIHELLSGNIVQGAVGPGNFVQPGYTHSIMIFGIDANGYVTVFDPYDPLKNGRYHISSIWDQRSFDYVDTMDGGPFFSLGKFTNNKLYVNIKDFGTIHVGDQAYTGSAINPTETLTFNVGGQIIKLTNGVDYEIVGYENNVNAGRAKVIIRGIGGYTGILTAFFDIVLDIVKDDIYNIGSSNSNHVIDVPAGSLSSGTNLQIYESNKTDAQKFEIKRLSDGYYTIKNILSGKYLSSSNDWHLLTNSLQISQRDYIGDISQKWMIKKVGEYYVISSAYDSKLVLDIRAGQIKNGNILQIYQYNGTMAQMWTLTQTVPMRVELDSLASQNKDVIADGNYMIQSEVNDKYVVDAYHGRKDNGSNVQIYESNNSDPQGWKIIHDEKGYVTFLNINSGLALDIQGALSQVGQNVQQYESNGTYAQKWVIVKEGDSYKIISALNPTLVLDLSKGKAMNENNIQIYTDNGSSAQKWNFVKFEESSKTINL